MSDPRSEAVNESEERKMTPDQERGLYEKYHIKRLNDPIGKHRDCEYYVLDLVHDRHAAPALLAYATSCEAEYPYLSHDLRAKAAAIPNAPPSTGPRAVAEELVTDADIASVLDWLEGRNSGGRSLTRAEAAAAIRRTYAATLPAQSATLPEGWVAISERLPVRGSWVIGYDGYKKTVLSVFFCQPGDFRVSSSAHENGWVGLSITHWMPLPAAPATGSCTQFLTEMYGRR